MELLWSVGAWFEKVALLVLSLCRDAAQTITEKASKLHGSELHKQSQDEEEGHGAVESVRLGLKCLDNFAGGVAGARADVWGRRVERGPNDISRARQKKSPRQRVALPAAQPTNSTTTQF